MFFLFLECSCCWRGVWCLELPLWSLFTRTTLGASPFRLWRKVRLSAARWAQTWSACSLSMYKPPFPPSTLSVCPAHERGTVKVCDDGKLRCPGFLCCLAHVQSKVRAWDWHSLVAPQLPDSESSFRGTKSCSSWRRATPGKRTSCARCFGMKRPGTSSHGSVIAKCIAYIFTWATFETDFFSLHSYAA